MKIDFLLPSRIESEDRLRNVITSVSYLLDNFPESKVYVKEVDKESNFINRALKRIERNVDTKNLIHIFEKSEDQFFHKTRILNDLFLESTSDIVYNYDVDIVVPVNSVLTAHEAIQNNYCDVIYPFGCGVYQWAVNYSEELMNYFIKSKYDLEYIRKNSSRRSSTVGWGQMIKREVYVSSYMWNENFVSWGAEDCEFYFRLNSLGYKVGRVDGDIYHFEHGRTFNSHYNNPKFVDNNNLWNWMRKQDKNEIISYYESQEYVKERRKKLNASV